MLAELVRRDENLSLTSKLHGKSISKFPGQPREIKPNLSPTEWSRQIPGTKLWNEPDEVRTFG
jgi:hypothetical protein